MRRAGKQGIQTAYTAIPIKQINENLIFCFSRESA